MTFSAPKISDMRDKAHAPIKLTRLPEDLKDALADDEGAWKDFQAFANSQRSTYINWVISTKREETRRSRMEEVVGKAKQGKKSMIG
jgi:uncharacterized protein YdeI (YjbR/CyaY-like superfamily)